MHTLATIDYLVLAGFLLATLAIGLYAGRGVGSFKDYATGNRVFGTGALALTLIASKISGINVIGNPANVFAEGVIAIAILARSITYVIAGYFIVPHAVHFPECMTLGDLMTRFYGRHSSWIAGVLSLLRSTMVSGINFVIIGTLCKDLLDINPHLAILISGLLLACYMAHGGIRSIIATDNFHFLLITTCIPLLGYLMLIQVGGLKSLFAQLPAEKLAIWDHPKFSYRLVVFLIWMIPAGLTGTPTMQRMLLGRTKQQLRNQYFLVAAYNAAFCVVILLIGLTGVVLYPTVVPKQLVGHAIQDLIPRGLQGLLVAGLLGACISSIDSHLHATGLTLAHDIFVPAARQRGWAMNELWCARVTTALVSACATALALYVNMSGTNTFRSVLMATNVTSPLLMFPLFSAMMGLKPHKRSFYMAMATTLVTFVLCQWLLPGKYGHCASVLCIAANGLSFFGSHYWHYGGFVVERRGTAVR